MGSDRERAVRPMTTHDKGDGGMMHGMRMGWLGLAAAAALIVPVRMAQGYDTMSVADGGTIAGTIKFTGTPPAAKTIKTTKDVEQCGVEVPDEALVVGGDKGIKNVVVRITDIAKGKAWDAKGIVDQKKCHFQPHVAVVQTGADVEILNGDGILHNIHTASTSNPSINKAQPKFKPKMTEKFAKPEIIKFACDVHPWMLGWLVVSEHPYVTVTDEKGAFKLTDVPAGTYKVEIWHETLGKQEKNVTVIAKGEAKLDIELAKP
jgi:plastocyanin